MVENSLAENSKVLVIGLDGAPWGLMNSWISEDRLPNLARLAKNGVMSPLSSTLPLGTAAAWSSIVTGKNPGKHGIFEFMARKEGSYDLMPVNTTFRKSKDVWDLLGDHGMKVGVMNVPFTYPPKSVNGFMITGMMTPNKESFTYPSYLKDDLEKEVDEYLIDVKEAYVEGREEIFLNDLHRNAESRTKSALYLMERFDWDFFMVVFTETDRVQHAFWEYMDPNHPSYTVEKAEAYGDVIPRYFQKMDSLIGELLKKVGENTSVVVLSDHGMGPLYRWIHLNNLLMKLGFLKLKNNMPSSLKRLLYKSELTPINLYKLLAKLGLGGIRKTAGRESVNGLLQLLFLSLWNVDWSRTKAYSTMGAGQIFINVRGREPEGVIEPGGECQNTKKNLIKRLSGFVDPLDGNGIFELIFDKQDFYVGPHLDRAPDIVLLPRKTYGVFPEYSFGSNSLITHPIGISATHTMDGFLIMNGPQIRSSVLLQTAEITDVAPTVLYIMGVPIPTDMDGNVLNDAMKASYLDSSPIIHQNISSEIEPSKSVYSTEDEEEIKKRLRALGYLS